MSVEPALQLNEEGVPSYLGRLTQSPLLTQEEENELTRASKAGDMRARQRLIESNMRLVINIAKGYKCRQIPLEDLIQEGAIGLMQATERFDPDRGFRFSTYATHWIRQAIGRAIDNKSKSIRIPAHVAQSIRRIEKERARLTRENGKEPTHDQLATALEIPVKKLQTLIQASQDLLSLDMTIGDGNGTTLAGLIPDLQSMDPESLILNEVVMDELKRIILELSEREQRVMQMRFRLDGIDDEKHQEEIARELHLSRERVRQIEVQAIRKLRILAQKHRLRELLPD